MSFELTGEDIARCLANKSVASIRKVPEASQEILAEEPNDRRGTIRETKNCFEMSVGEICNEMTEKGSEERGGAELSEAAFHFSWVDQIVQF